jgi:hypothetical protein
MQFNCTRSLVLNSSRTGIVIPRNCTFVVNDKGRYHSPWPRKTTRGVVNIDISARAPSVVYSGYPRGAANASHEGEKLPRIPK